eukprot:scaffold2029_cov181-Amphora_coffeaeformis.AAC.7
MPTEKDPLLAKNGHVDDEEEEDHGGFSHNRRPSDINDKDEETFATIRVLEPTERTLHDGVSPLRSGNVNFWDDLKRFTPGSMPHSVVVGVTIGIMCGVLAYAYYTVLEWLLEFFWRTLPEQIMVPYVDKSLQWVWIPILGFIMALGVGLSVMLLGEPGDLSYTVQCVHDKVGGCRTVLLTNKEKQAASQRTDNGSCRRRRRTVVYSFPLLGRLTPLILLSTGLH